MGHNPEADWPTPPFRRDRNHLLVAAQRGFGTVDLSQIDFQSDIPAPVAHFDCDITEEPEIIHKLRRTACEQGLYYRDKQKKIVDQYRGEFIYMQDGNIVWHGLNPSVIASHRSLNSTKPGAALWLKFVDPEEIEGERFEVYDQCLSALSA